MHFPISYRKSLLFITLLISLKLIAVEPPPPTRGNGQDLFKRDTSAFILTGECLYWTTVEGALDYATRMTKPLPMQSSTLAQGNVESGSFDWDPGYRLSLGYFRAPKFWEVQGEYTYIRTSGSNQISSPAESDLFLNGTFPHLFSGSLSKAKSSISLRYHLTNLLAKRVFLLLNNPHLRLRLGGGLTMTWLRQSWKVRYFESQSSETTTAKNRWRYWGVGPRLQLSFDWFLGADFYLTGLFSTAIVVGHYRNRFRQQQSESVGNALLKDYRFSLNARFLLGSSYQKNLSWGRVEAFIGYELTSWNNLQEVYRSITSDPSAAKQLWINRSLVAFHGPTARLTLNF